MKTRRIFFSSVFWNSTCQAIKHSKPNISIKKNIVSIIYSFFGERIRFDLPLLLSSDISCCLVLGFVKLLWSQLFLSLLSYPHLSQQISVSIFSRSPMFLPIAHGAISSFVSQNNALSSFQDSFNNIFFYLNKSV